MKTRSVLAGALAVLVCGCGGESFPPLEGWGPDLKAAREQARASGKPLCILYSAAWSDAAARFEREALADGAVKKELSRFVRVRVSIDEHRDAEEKYGIKWVPSLVFESPLGEVKTITKGDWPAEYVAGEVRKLGEWKPLPGWESDPALARKKAAESGKPLAVLYSAAWSSAAVAFEQGVLPKAREALAGKFTLLRLNRAQSKAEAEAAGVEREEVPALLLPGGEARERLVPGEQCTVELLTSFVEGLSGYRQAAGWLADLAAAEKEAGRRRMPRVVVLDKAADWNSHYFRQKVLASPEVAKLLPNFVRARQQFSPDLELVRRYKIREADVPCLLIFQKSLDLYEPVLTHRDPLIMTILVNNLRDVGGRAKTGGKAGG